MQFKLLQPAFIANQLLPAGTVIGDGTAIPASAFTPGPHMQPLDADARVAQAMATAALVAKRRRSRTQAPEEPPRWLHRPDGISINVD